MPRKLTESMVYVSKYFQKTATAGDERMPQRRGGCILAQDLACLSAQTSFFNNYPVKNKNVFDSDTRRVFIIGSLPFLCVDSMFTRILNMIN